MPVGYTILQRQKNQPLPVKKRDSYLPQIQLEKTAKSFYDEPKPESTMASS